ncbi:hypothetical protein B0H21DRAFT_280472 [Amylocystis lapponica]|nr:hypothetical protein B0H21DRAFT_280472 [Amylocystis lapponica]
MSLLLPSSPPLAHLADALVLLERNPHTTSLNRPLTHPIHIVSASMTSVAHTSPPSLFSMARNKLQSAVANGVKDSCSLHRWVLLKNSILRSHTPDVVPAALDTPDVTYVYRQDAEEGQEEEQDAFEFPDPHSLGPRDAGVADPENAWLDSVLETLGDDDLDIEADVGVSVSVLPVDEDDEPLSPLYSPISSSDDLVASSFYYNPPPISAPYPIPYPPLHPPLVPSWFELEECVDSHSDASPPHYHDPLPYYDVDDTADMAVPDAIEDLSDDESDALSTPCYNSLSSLSPADPASIPLPHSRTRLRSHPQVYIDTDDSYFYPFELDPPPFHDDDTARAYRPSVFQEC